MEKPPRITALIPAFGRPESLARAVASALAAIEDGDEVIVVDDGSSPPVALDPHPALRLIRSDRNRGAAAARNLGIAATRTPLIAFLDSDDEWLPGKLGAQRPMFGTGAPDPLLAVCCGWLDTRDGVPFRGRMPRASRSRADFFAGNWFAPGSTLVVAREAFAALGTFDEALPRLEDYEWFLRFARAGGRLEVAPIAGAKIAAGRNAHLPAIAAAAAAITERHANAAGVTREERRAMDAWLALNRALGSRNDGWPFGFAAAMARSLLLKPRTRVQLQQWWTPIDPGGH